MTKPRQAKTTIFLGFLLVFGGSRIFASAQASPSDTLEELLIQQKLAEAKKSIAEAQKAEFDAKYPKPDVDALKSNSSVEGSPIEAAVQAYRAVQQAADQVAIRSQNKGIKGLYVFRESDFAKIVSYRNLDQRLDVIVTEYGKCSPGAVGMKAVPIGIVAGVLLKWLPLLKTETTIKGLEFNVDDEAVLASLANKLALKGIQLNSPFSSHFDFVNLGRAPSSLEGKLNFVIAERAKVCSNPYPLKAQLDAAVDKLLSEVGLSIAVATNEKQLKSTVATATPPTTTTIESTEKFAATAPPQSLVTLWDYLKTEQIISYMNQNAYYWIKIKAVKTGGNIKVKKNPLIDVFRGGSSVKFSGGSVVYYYVLDNDGQIIDSDVIRGYSPYQKATSIMKP
jgi:hypothetical protein